MTIGESEVYIHGIYDIFIKMEAVLGKSRIPSNLMGTGRLYGTGGPLILPAKSICYGIERPLEDRIGFAGKATFVNALICKKRPPLPVRERGGRIEERGSVITYFYHVPARRPQSRGRGDGAGWGGS